jgi:hypothetical protein
MYQPPWQDVNVLRQINEECYLPILYMLDRHENAKITLNIQGCLLEMLHANGMDITIELLKKHVQSGKIEIVGTGMYHPILPLIPVPEINTQIKLHEAAVLKYINPKWEKKGFFPPEMAVSPDIAPIIEDQGYNWMIMGGIANTKDWPINYIQEHESGILTFFRDDYISNEISFKKIDATGFVQKLEAMHNDHGDTYIITAQDAETFGHHIKRYETTFLGTVFSLIEEKNERYLNENQGKDKLIKVDFISNLSKRFPIITGCNYRSCSWSTDWEDIQQHIPFPLWMHPENDVHKAQYRMLKALYDLMAILDRKIRESIESDSNTNNDAMELARTARWFYNQAIHSCWLWWASQRPMWNPNLIYKGADLVIKTALNSQLALISMHVGEGDVVYQIIMEQMKNLMTKMVEHEIRSRKVRTF